MAVITRDAGAFNGTSKHGATAYGAIVNFDMPAFASISSVVVTFVTHGGGGDTQDRAFSINGSRAHASNVWAQNSLALTAGLIVAGTNTFRVTLKSQPDGVDYGTMCTWNISGVTLTITYEPPYVPPEPDPEPPPDPAVPYLGTMWLGKTSVMAGDSLTLDVSWCDASFTRYIRIRYNTPGTTGYNTILSVVHDGWGSTANGWLVNVPLAWLPTIAPNTTSVTLSARVEIYDGPTYVGFMEREFTVYVPGEIVPSIWSFNLSKIAGGVPAEIGGYVKGYSGVACEIASPSGAYGSTIVSTKIEGDGRVIWAPSGNITKLTRSGTIYFYATVTDSRGRIATKTASVTVLDYSPPTVLLPTVSRATIAGLESPTGTYAKTKGQLVFSSLNGDNEGKYWGRVYEKGDTPPAFTQITDPNGEWLTGGGDIAINHTYILELKASDLLNEYVYVVEIPTVRAHINAYPSETGGIAFGGYAEEEDAAVFKYTKLKHFDDPIPSLGVGDVLVTFNATSPALRWPGTVWSAIQGRFLLGADATYVVDTTGGAATHTLTQAELPAVSRLPAGILTGAQSGGAPINTWGWLGLSASQTIYSQGYDMGGNLGSGNAHTNMPPWLAVYIWRRTA